MAEVLSPAAPANALGVYLTYHAAALRLAVAWGDPSTRPEDRPGIARLALSAEAFALHFLEDAFAAGHTVGSWGDAAERKGTHDYYNLHGLEASDWQNTPFILYGDGYLRPEGLDQAARVVEISLAQFLEATDPSSRIASGLSGFDLDQARADTSFNICRSVKMPAQNFSSEALALLAVAVPYTPVPGLGPGPASLPRYRADIGSFVGVAAGGSIGETRGTWSPGAWVDAASLTLSARAGFGLESLTGPSGDGQLWAEAGLLVRNSEGFVCGGHCGRDTPVGSQILIPSRSAISMRVRVPFWLVPGDLVVAAPILALAAPKALDGMVIGAVNGGAIPWQAGFRTPAGRFQFILGREVGLTLYGYLGGPDAVTILPVVPSGYGIPMVYQMKSIGWEFPVLEGRLLRAFSGKQVSTFVIQTGFGYERTTRVRPIGGVGGTLRPGERYMMFLRVTFDSRLTF